MTIFDGNLKQRLIGAAVLIILAVVFLPMIFNNKGEKLPETIVTVPLEPTRPSASINNSQPQSDIITTNTATNTQAAQVETPLNQPELNTQAVIVTATPPAQTGNTKPAQNANIESTTTPPVTNSISPSWTIQVAASSNLQNAETFTNKLRKSNYNAYIRTEGNLHRVFVGPFIKKTEAARVQQLIEKQFNEKGIIREFKPEKQ